MRPQRALAFEERLVRQDAGNVPAFALRTAGWRRARAAGGSPCAAEDDVGCFFVADVDDFAQQFARRGGMPLIARLARGCVHSLIADRVAEEQRPMPLRFDRRK